MIVRGILSMETENKADRDKRFVGAIFTFKSENGYVQELLPQMIKNINEPLYQARFISNWRELGLRKEYLVVSTRISSMFLMEFKQNCWEIRTALKDIHVHRKIVINCLAVMCLKLDGLEFYTASKDKKINKYTLKKFAENEEGSIFEE